VWDAAIIAYLEFAMRCDCNALIAGNTGSGKTTTLNALAHLFPQNERIITIEETPELSLLHPHRVSLFPKTDSRFDMPRLIRETLRMRPDRVIVGEVRFPEEAHAFMESILAGQGKGTYGTFHGHSALEAIARLKQYGILEQDLGWIDLLIIQRRWNRIDKGNTFSSPVRKIMEVVELEYVPSQGLRTRPVFTYEPTTDTWEAFPSLRVAERFPLYFPHAEWNESFRARVRELMGGNAHARIRTAKISTPAKGPAVGIRN
jgi:Flp pilus assembly CpaF family ATPase